MNLDQARHLVAQRILPRYPNVQAAVIGGSIARGEGTATSDIDLLLVFDDVPAAWRDTFKVDGQTVELFGHDARTFEYFCRMVDRPGGRMPLAMMVMEGASVLGENAGHAALRALAARLYAEGPAPLAADALASRRYEITTLLEDLADNTAADETLAIAARLYEALATFVLRAGGAWTGGGKHLARRLRAHSPAIAADLHAAMTQTVAGEPAGKAAFAQLVERALAPYGGQLLEGYTLHAPAEWKSAAPPAAG